MLSLFCNFKHFLLDTIEQYTNEYLAVLLMIQHKSDFNKTKFWNKITNEKDSSHFVHNVEKCSSYLKNPVVFILQGFKSLFNHFCTLRRKGINYNFQEYVKRITSII